MRHRRPRQPRIERCDAFDHPLDGEFRVEPPPPLPSQLLPKDRVLQQARDRSAQGVRVAGGDDQSGLTVTVHPWHPGRQIRADDRLGARHGLELHDAERFVGRDRRQHEDVAGVVQREQVRVGHLADEVDLPCDGKGVGEPPKLTVEGARADDHGVSLEAAQRA
ncbi:MAG: hypothetical protein DME13_00695 [Candidatus Rokuibacteriota bacterium]|nr:MAG: hypothetical protein DME13_00695 [Candidatus Rokubacteria bacterium]